MGVRDKLLGLMSRIGEKDQVCIDAMLHRCFVDPAARKYFAELAYVAPAENVREWIPRLPAPEKITPEPLCHRCTLRRCMPKLAENVYLTSWQCSGTGKFLAMDFEFLAGKGLPKKCKIRVEEMA